MNDKPVIVSLGYNCEISFRIEDYYGKLDSYLFSWSFEDSRKGFIKALENIEDVFEGDLELCSDHMIRDKKYQIRFHPRYDILPKFGETTDKQFEEAVKELKSRIDYLKSKTINLFNSNKRVVFIIKVESRDVSNNIKYINKVKEIFDGYKTLNYILVAVLEKKSLKKEIKDLESDRLKIRTVRKFAPIKHTDIMGDMSGWNKILREFSELDQDDFNRNVLKRRIHIIPLMVKNKINRIIRKQ